MDTSGASDTRWECLAFEPIAWSGKDTQETIAGIIEHNAVWDALCKGGSGADEAAVK